MMSLRLKLKLLKKPKSQRLRYDLEKLKDPEVEAQFKAKIGGYYAPLLVHDISIDDMTNQMEESLHTAASEILGPKRTKRKPWMTEYALQLCDQRRQLKSSKFEHPELYRNINNAVRSEIKRAKEQWLLNKCETVESEIQKGNCKAAYTAINTILQPPKPKATAIKDKDGKLLTDVNKITERWTEYCTELYNYSPEVDSTFLLTEVQYQDEGNNPVLREEVQKGIKALKNGKSPGIDNIPAELIKKGGHETEEQLTKICQKIWETKTWPEKWTQSVVIPIPKKGRSQDCENHRTISGITQTLFPIPQKTW